jgi:hypothetical protein
LNSFNLFCCLKPPLQHREAGKRKTIVIVAEGAHDADLKPIRAEYVKEILTERVGLDTRVTTLGHTQRGGRPCAFDRILVGFRDSFIHHYSMQLNLADATRRGGCQGTLRGYARHSIVHDWCKGE